MKDKLLLVMAVSCCLAFTHGFALWYGNETGKNAREARHLKESNALLAERLLTNQQDYDSLVQSLSAITLSYEEELRAVRDTHAAATGRVRLHTEICAPARQAQTPAPGGDGHADTGAAFLPEEFTEALRHTQRTADEVTATLRSLRKKVDATGCFASQGE